MLGFLNVEDVLSDLRSGESVLTEKIYYLSFDSEKNSQHDLEELKSRCARLGYSFNNVEIFQSHKSTMPTFFYLVRNLPAHAGRAFTKHALFEQVTG